MPAPLIGLTTRNLTAPTSDFPMIASPKSYTNILMKTGAIPILVPVNLEEEYYLDLPFMGICRGLQLIIIALGGTLFTHIADQLPADYCSLSFFGSFIESARIHQNAHQAFRIQTQAAA
ncbi:MAG: gamma-glutamyl-gamma-aminobutyrate hydrolase family protein [Chloroflexota bacterium]